MSYLSFNVSKVGLLVVHPTSSMINEDIVLPNLPASYNPNYLNTHTKTQQYKHPAPAVSKIRFGLTTGISIISFSRV